MGSKLTKTKTTTTTTITESTIEQEKILPVSTSKKTTPTKKKTNKEAKSKINGSKSKVDQSTNTDHYLLITSSGEEHLVGNQPSLLLTAISHSEQINSAYQSESIHDDAEQLRQTCIRNTEELNQSYIIPDGESKETTSSSVMTIENEVKIQQNDAEHSSMTE